MICAPFAGGQIVAIVIRVPRIAELLRRRVSAAAAMAAMTAVIFLFPTVYAPAPLMLLLFSMAVVAADNDLFGTLRWRGPQALGNWGYSLYLLHGIALYTLFAVVIGLDRAARLSGVAYLAVIAGYVPVVLALAWASHRWVESPPMRAVPVVVEKLRSLAAAMRRRGRPAIRILPLAPATLARDAQEAVAPLLTLPRAA
jgi:peptidoglycan/LPS O-acetylase OafA/YrhL